MDSFPPSFPYRIVDVDPETNSELSRIFPSPTSNKYVFVGPKKYLLNDVYRKDANKLWNFKVRPDDIWITTFPRSGTTMTQDLIWLIANNFDYEGASIGLEKRFPFFEFYLVAPPEIVGTSAYESFQQVEERRFIKSHLPVSLLPFNVLESGAKLVYIARHPKDVIVSLYHLARLVKNIDPDVSFEKYYDTFERDLTFWGPYWQHIQEGWEHRDHPNVLFMFYENMIADFATVAKQIGDFLNLPVPDEELPKLAEHMNIDNFKKNPAVNSYGGEFVRRGKTHGWQDEFTPELRKRAEKWIAENLKNTDFRFPDILLV